MLNRNNKNPDLQQQKSSKLSRISQSDSPNKKHHPLDELRRPARGRVNREPPRSQPGEPDGCSAGPRPQTSFGR